MLRKRAWIPYCGGDGRGIKKGIKRGLFCARSELIRSYFERTESGFFFFFAARLGSIFEVVGHGTHYADEVDECVMRMDGVL